eukprot:Awhi_evm1s7530
MVKSPIKSNIRTNYSIPVKEDYDKWTRLGKMKWDAGAGYKTLPRTKTYIYCLKPYDSKSVHSMVRYVVFQYDSG